MLRPEKLYSFVDVRLISAAASVLLISLEPWAVTRKAIHYCGSDTHLCCRLWASDVHGAKGCYEMSFTVLWM